MTWLESGSLCSPGPWTGRRRSALFFLDRGSERKYFPLRLAGFFPYSKLTRTFFFACTDSLFRAHRCLPSFDGFLGSALFAAGQLCSPGLPPLLRLLPGLRRRQEAATSLLPPNWQSEPSPPAGAPKVPLGSSRSRWERLRPGKALVAADFLFPGRAAMPRTREIIRRACGSKAPILRFSSGIPRSLSDLGRSRQASVVDRRGAAKVRILAFLFCESTEVRPFSLALRRARRGPHHPASCRRGTLRRGPLCGLRRSGAAPRTGAYPRRNSVTVSQEPVKG